jgi:hypothetical protein
VKLSFVLFGAASLLASVRGQVVPVTSLSGDLPPGEGPALPPPVRTLPTIANFVIVYSVLLYHAICFPTCQRPQVETPSMSCGDTLMHRAWLRASRMHPTITGLRDLFVGDEI